MPRRIPKKMPEFWKHVEKDSQDPANGRVDIGKCWLWRGQLRKGYGDVYWQGLHLPAHRVSCQMEHGPAPSDDENNVLHACDTPLCVRPEHLRWGTNRENVEDRTSRMRGGTQFTPDDVRAIRRRAAAGETPYAIVKDYPGCSATAVENVIKRKTWAHLSDEAEEGGASGSQGVDAGGSPEGSPPA
jgi:hypothetical protein